MHYDRLFDFDKKDGVDDFVSDLEAEGFRKEEIEVYKTVVSFFRLLTVTQNLLNSPGTPSKLKLLNLFSSESGFSLKKEIVWKIKKKQNMKIVEYYIG